MNTGLQEYNIGVDFATNFPRIDGEQIDFKAWIDPSLHYGENKQNIRKHHGAGESKHGHAFAADIRQIHTDQTEHGRYIDSLLSARRPGSRRSANGRWYTERRANRSDMPDQVY
jgi:hypothetical protein